LRFSPCLVTQALALSDLLVGQACALGLDEGILFDQESLALVTASGAAEAHDHGGQPAGFLVPARQSRVPGSEEDQMVEVGATQAERSRSLHDQQLSAV